LSLSDEAFLASIANETLKKKYYSKLRSESAKIRKQFHAERETLRDNIVEGLKDYEEHDTLVNLSIFPFVQNYPPRKLGYKLNACDPLLEKGKRNFDFLIAKEDDDKFILIFGEAKIDRDHFERIVDEVIEKIRVVNEEINTIAEEYLKNTTKKILFEVAISIHGNYVDKLQSALEEKLHENASQLKDIERTRIVIWKIDINNNSLERSEPGYNNSLHHRLVHADAKLNSRINRIEVSGSKVLNFFSQSHIVTKLSALIGLVVSNKIMKKGANFSLSELSQYLEKEFGYIHSNYHEKIVNEIVNAGLDIGLLEKLDPTTYAIKKEFSGGSLNERIIVKLWIKQRLHKELQRRLETYRIDLQREISAEFKALPRSESLEKFF
jgi:hypothetical protein